MQANLLLDSNCENSNYTSTIVGYNNNLYIVYQKADKIKITRSTNHGSSWNSNIIPQISMINSNCKGIDACTDPKGLFVVWGTKIGNDYETYYYRYHWGLSQWIEFKNVTDYDPYSQKGGRPSVTTSENKAHVAYNIYSSDPIGYPSVALTRDFNFITQQWEVPQIITITIFPEPPVQGYEVDYNGTVIERINAKDGYLHIVLYEYVEINYEVYFYLYHKKRPVNSTNWDPEYFITYELVDPYRIVKPVFTSNNNMHIIYNRIPDIPFANPRLSHSFYNLVTGYWYGPYDVSTPIIDIIWNFCLSESSNDLYAHWLYYYTAGYPKMYYSQYDAAPLAPQNLAVSVYQTPYNSHPKLDWTPNNEPDVRIANPGYQIFRKIDYGQYGQNPIATVSGTTFSYIDYQINYAGGGPGTAFYKIKAVDVGNHISPFSNEVSIHYGDAWKIGTEQTEGEVFEYNLLQNYPNPFNPTTTINYSIKSAGLVSLKIYDMLGTEVASLVNERQEPGSYSVEFNASNLPSGMYVYKLTAGDFVEGKKLSLIK